MLTLVFAVTAIICGIGWITNHVAVKSILYYMAQKGYKPPADAEIKECTLAVIKRLFKISK